MQIDLTNYPKDRNPHTGHFLKNSIPHNKGKSWIEWMDGRKKRKILKNLQHKGNPNLAGANAKTIVGIKNGKFCVFGGWNWFFENDNEWLKLINNGN